MTDQTVCVSPRRRFYHFAFPCLEDRYRTGKVSASDYRHLKRCRLFPRLDPEADLLERAFPNAWQRLQVYAKREGLNPWSDEAVTGYWHGHHEGIGHCAVRLGTVKEIKPKHTQGKFDSFLVDCSGSGVFVSNPFLFPLKVGDLVYIHWGKITEKVG
jgi:hypothetical protein